jgi:nicotinamidase/pyrazinamidase
MGRVLLIVDYQNDFTPPEGALPVPEGDEIAEAINREAERGDYDKVIATRDWHPPEHGSFESRGGPWPEHCVQGTTGAALDPRLDTEEVDLVLDKGRAPDTPGYSAFEEGTLTQHLRGEGIGELTVTGLATDVCVRATALDALEEGFDVEVIRDATRGVDPDDSERALWAIAEAGGEVR